MVPKTIPQEDEMGDGHDHSHTFEGLNDDYRRRLLLVTAINIVMFGARPHSQDVSTNSSTLVTNNRTWPNRCDN